MGLGDLLVRVGANIDGFTTAMGTVSQRLDALDRQATKATSGFDKMGDRLTGIGIGVTASLTAPLAAAGFAATKFASEFELGMRQVTSLLGGVSDKQFRELSDATRELSQRLGVDAVKSTHALYEAISAGVPTDNALTFLEVASKAAIAGVTDTKVAVDGMTNIINAFGLNMSQAQEVSDAMFQSVNVGKFTFEQLSAAVGIASGTAAQMNIDFKELLASAASITKQGFSVAEAFTNLQSVMTALIKPNQNMVELLKKTGYESGEALLKAKGLQGAIQALDIAAEHNSGTLAEAYGRVEALKGSLALTGNAAVGAAKDLDQITNSAGAADKAFREIDKTTSRQFDRLTQEVKATAIGLGTALLPAVNDLLKASMPLVGMVADAVRWFSTLPSPVQNTAIAFTAVVAAVGPVLIAFGATASALASIGSALTLVRPLVVAFASTTMPAAISAVVTFATTAVPAAISALTTFAVSTIPAAVTAVSVMAEMMLTQAAGSFLNFAKTAVPAAIAAVVTFATTTIPSAVAAITSFSLTTIPQLTASFVAMASTGVAGATSAITTFATTAIPAAIGAVQTLALTVLPLLGVAAAVGAAAFAGWNIGKWAYDAIPGVKALGDGLAGLILYVPGVQSLIDRMGGLKQATSDLAAGTAKLEALAAKLGVNISELSVAYKSGGLSLEKYNDKLNELLRSKLGASKATTDNTKTETEAEKQAKKLAIETKRLTDQLSDQTKQTRAVDAATKPYIKTADALAAVWRKVETEERKVIETGADASRWLSEHGKKTVALTDVSDDLTASITALAAAADLTGPAMAAAGKAAGDAFAQAKAPLQALDEAFKSLGITSSLSLGKQAAEAKAAYEAIKSSGIASSQDINAAWVAMEEKRIAAAKAAGIEIPAEQQKSLDKMKDQLGISHKDQKEKWSDWSKQISTIVTDWSKETGKILFDGDLSWGEKGKKMLESLGQAVTRMFVEPAQKAIGDLIGGAIQDLMGGKGFGGIIDKVKDLGSTIGSVFGGGASAAGSVAGGAADLGVEAGGAAGNAAGGISGAGGQAGSAIASGGLTAIVGAVGSVVSAISGVIGNFQMAKMETSLNAIEHNTRYSMMFLGERSDGGILGVLFRIQENTQYLNPLLDGLNAKLIDWLAPLNDTLGSIDQKGYWALAKLDEVRDGITDMRAKVQAHLDIAQQSVQILDQVRAGINTMTSGRGSFTINIQGGTAADRNLLNSAFTQLRAQGAMI